MRPEVKLSSVARCALVQAFARNVPALRKWGQVLPMQHLRTLMSIPPNVHWFTLDDQASTVYRAFALAERERLATCGPEHGLHCAHRPLEHRNALDEILRQLPMPTSQ